MLTFIFLIFTFLIITIIKIKNKKSILKNKHAYKQKNIPYACFFSRRFGFKVLNIKQENLRLYTLCELKQTDEILSSVIFNLPNVYKSIIDYNQLKNTGIDISVPIFVVNNIIISNVKAINYAFLKHKFNLIILAETPVDRKILQNLKVLFKVIYKTHVSSYLLSNLLCANINYCNQSHLILKEQKEDVMFGIKNKTLSCFEKIEDNKIFGRYEDDNIQLQYRAFFYMNNYLICDCVSKKNTLLNINFFKQFNENNLNYNYIKTTSKLMQAQNMQSGTKFFVKTTKSCNFHLAHYKTENGNFKSCISGGCNVKMQAKQKQTFSFVFGKNINQVLDFCKCERAYETFAQEKFKIKIDCKNAKLAYYVNFFLPQKIVAEKFVTKQQIESNDFLECIDFYKRYQISALDFYNCLIKNIIGYSENDEFIKINPSLKEDFKLKIQLGNNVLVVDVLVGDGNRFAIINGVKYYNLSILSKKSLANNCAVTLVI